jgi:hypothetical protein
MSIQAHTPPKTINKRGKKINNFLKDLFILTCFCFLIAFILTTLFYFILDEEKGEQSKGYFIE